MNNLQIFFNGTIITMEEKDAPPPQALLVENGRIREWGDVKSLMNKASEAKLVDLEGGTLLPAFLDAHSHFFQLALSLLQVSLKDAKSPEDVIASIRTFIQKKNLPHGQWVIAGDFDQNKMPGRQNLTLNQLDLAAPDHPLIIKHQSGHMGFFNSAALTLLGVTPDTPVPEGGTIAIQDGQLTGYMEENAFFEYQRQVPMPGKEDIIEAFAEAQEVYASYGITTIQEGMLVEEMLPFYDLLLSHHLLKLDLVAYAGFSSYAEIKTALAPHMGRYQDRLKIGGIKIFLDGSPQGRTAWMRKPYEGTSFCGYPTMTDESVKEAFTLAAKEKTQLLAHVNGDGAAAQYLRCLDAVQEQYPILSTLRPVIIHGQLMGKDQLKEAARLHALISFFVAHIYHWGDTHIQNFGMERASHISPAASALKEGISITFHQDSPVIPPDMMETLWCAVCRRSRDGVVLGPEEAISPWEALKAVTIQAAYQYGEKQKKGSLAPGKLADLVILNQNPLTCPKDSLREIKVIKTFKEGNCIWQSD